MLLVSWLIAITPPFSSCTIQAALSEMDHSRTGILSPADVAEVLTSSSFGLCLHADEVEVR